MKKTKIGIIGSGTIAETYLQTLEDKFDNVEIVACSDLVMEKAQSLADDFGIRACTNEELLSDPEIEIVINAMTPQAHTSVNLAILEAGKHIYCEKPLALNLEEAKMIVEKAKSLGLCICGAPDHFMSAPVQAARRFIDQGKLGNVIHVVANIAQPGPECWHPSPAFYYKEGGGPVLDLGPYYMGALISILGPVKKVFCVNRKTYEERTITSAQYYGTVMKVEVPTFYQCIIEFACGAVCSLLASFDTWLSTGVDIEIHGTKASMLLPNPGFWGGKPRVLTKEDYARVWNEVGFLPHLVDSQKRYDFFTPLDLPAGSSPLEQRGWGVADMASAIEHGRPARTNADFVLHCLELFLGIDESGKTGLPYEMTTTCERPAPIPEDLPAGETD